MHNSKFVYEKKNNNYLCPQTVSQNLKLRQLQIFIRDLIHMFICSVISAEIGIFSFPKLKSYTSFGKFNNSQLNYIFNAITIILVALPV